MIWAILALLAVGLLLILLGKSTRHARGLTDGRTLALDNRTLFSPRFQLAGRPDRIVEENGSAIPEEWKSAHRVHDTHRAQMGTYFILIEEETGTAPPYGYLVLGTGEKHQIGNTPELRAWVLEIAEKIRKSRREPRREIPVNQSPGKCRGCGMREWCGQRSG